MGGRTSVRASVEITDEGAPALQAVHGLRETQGTGLARKIIGTRTSISPPSPLHTLGTRTASKKVAVVAHHLHLDALPYTPHPFWGGAVA